MQISQLHEVYSFSYDAESAVGGRLKVHVVDGVDEVASFVWKERRTDQNWSRAKIEDVDHRFWYA